MAGIRSAAPAAPKRPSLSSRDFPSAAPPPPVDKKKLWNFPPPETPPALPPDMAAAMTPAKAPSRSPASAPPPSSLPPKNDPALILGMMEEKFSDLTRRIASIEHPKKDGSGAPAYLEPLIKRVQDMESEVKNMKFAFTQLAAAQNAININDLMSKIQGIQKVLENLTGGTDVAKPS